MKTKLCALLTLLALLLGGCTPSRQIENQAHAISMGLDLTDGKICMSVQVPTIGAGSGEGSGSASATEYSIYSATAKDFPLAYDLLLATVPQRLNLTQLKSIIFSEALARSERFFPILRSTIHIFSLSGSAIVLVSRAPAREILENQEAYIGTHLSISMPAMLEYYRVNGYIPQTSLSLLYAGLKSVYSTGKAALCGLEGSEPPQDGSYLPGALDREGDNRDEFMGCALFNRNRMVGILDGHETQMMQLLSGESTEIGFTLPDSSVRLSQRRSPQIEFSSEDGRMRIDVTLRLRVIPLMETPDLDELKATLETAMQAVLKKCAEWEVEPFGFADAAVVSHLTFDSWDGERWPETFSQAETRAHVVLSD